VSKLEMTLTAAANLYIGRSLRGPSVEPPSRKPARSETTTVSHRSVSRARVYAQRSAADRGYMF